MCGNTAQKTITFPAHEDLVHSVCDKRWYKKIAKKISFCNCPKRNATFQSLATSAVFSRSEEM